MLNDAQAPSIPSNIFNVTDGAYAFYIENAQTNEGDLIKVAINQNMVPQVTAWKKFRYTISTMAIGSGFQ